VPAASEVEHRGLTWNFLWQPDGIRTVPPPRECDQVSQASVAQCHAVWLEQGKRHHRVCRVPGRSGQSPLHSWANPRAGKLPTASSHGACAAGLCATDAAAVGDRLRRIPLGCRRTATRDYRSGRLANPAGCKHNASVPNVLIRDLPPEVHANLQRRAEAAGQSLQQYLTSELSRVAQSPTIAEVLGRIAERSGGRVGLQTAVDDLHDERARR
jgi:antitoxin FitA